MYQGHYISYKQFFSVWVDSIIFACGSLTGQKCELYSGVPSA